MRALSAGFKLLADAVLVRFQALEWENDLEKFLVRIIVCFLMRPV